MAKRILVTGAGGYIGSIATYLLLQKGYEVLALDNFNTGYRQPLELLQEKFGEKQLKVVEFDLKGYVHSVFEQEKNIDAVLHYAAHCKVDESMKRPQKYFSNNVVGTQNLLRAMLAHGVNKIIFSSTCAVYGEAQYVPIDEKHPTAPESPYGESKKMSETIMQWYGRQVGLSYVILRYFNVCGASDDSLIGDSKKPSVLLVQNAVRGAMGLEPFKLTYSEVDTADKSPIRDYINVVDLNEAHIVALEKLLNGDMRETINLGTGTGNSVLEIVHKVEQSTGKTIPLEKGEARQGESAKMIANIDKAKAVLGWTPKRKIGQTVESLVKWYADHPNGWEK